MAHRVYVVTSEQGWEPVNILASYLSCTAKEKHWIGCELYTHYCKCGIPKSTLSYSMQLLEIKLAVTRDYINPLCQVLLLQHTLVCKPLEGNISLEPISSQKYFILVFLMYINV